MTRPRACLIAALVALSAIAAQYEATRIASTHTIRIGETGGYDATSCLRFGTAPEWKGVEITYMRRAT